MSNKVNTIFDNLNNRWGRIRESRRFRASLLYLCFVGIATLFWFMLALNDNIQYSFDVDVRVNNVPDSVTFIDDPPATIHVNVRDKGTSLMRSGLLKKPVLNINFNEYAQKGVFRFSPSDLYASLRVTFGTSAQISSVSVDSLRLAYTGNPGRRVRITIPSDITPATGFVIAGNLKCSNSTVLLFSDNPDADTITSVRTRVIRKRDISSTENVEVLIDPIPGVKIVPQKVSVLIPVESLVKKKSTVPVNVVNVPPNQSLLIFPANVDVTYFVPLSRFNDPTPEILVVADYNDAVNLQGRNIPVMVAKHDKVCRNVTLLTDSVEYTIVKQ